MRRPRQSGFTLIELMVALAILAIVALSANARTLDTLAQMQHLEMRTLASWIAENEMAAMRAASGSQIDQVPDGNRTRRQLMAGREWRIDVSVSATTHPWLRRVEVDVVALDDMGAEGQRHQLVGFLGQR